MGNKLETIYSVNLTQFTYSCSPEILDSSELLRAFDN